MSSRGLLLASPDCNKILVRSVSVSLSLSLCVSICVCPSDSLSLYLFVSPSFSQTAHFQALDTVNEEIEYFTGTWGWNSGNPTRLIPTADGKRIAILYTTNVLRVYNRLTWEFEKVTGLKGRVIDAVWSPTSGKLSSLCGRQR